MRKDIAFGGVSRSPGGATSADGDLMGAVNMCNDGAGLEMLEKPQKLFTLDRGETFLCIHEPEGESRHYITQILVPTAPISGDIEGGGGVEGGEDGGTTTPTTPYRPRRHGFADHTEDIVVNGDILDGGGGGSGGSGGYSGGGGSGSNTTSDGTYIEPDINPEDDLDIWDGNGLADKYATVIASENETRANDDGGESAETEQAGHLYLRWRSDNGDGTSTVEQSIDISTYGAVTAIQAMGNTLVCNHEGSEYRLPEVRYYLWKTDSEEVAGEEVDTSRYVGLGSKPPMLDITFGLESEFKYWPTTKTTETSGDGYKKKYKGVYITSYPYTDTVPVFWSDSEKTSYVPPYKYYDSYAAVIVPGGTSNWDRRDYWREEYSLDGVVSPDGKTDVAGMKVNWTMMALGCYNKFIAEQHNKNKFVFPFYVRYCYELYDGSQVMHSYPVLMIPNSRGPIFALDGRYGLKADRDDAGQTYEKVRLEFRGRTYGFASTLMHQVKSMAATDLARLKNWKDLIRGVNIYVTPPIYNYKQGGQVLGWHCMDTNAPSNNGENPWNKHYTVGRVNYTDHSIATPEEKHLNGAVTLDQGFSTILPAELNTPTHLTDYYQIFQPWVEGTEVCPTPDYCLTIPQKEEKEITELHENAGQFYKLVSIEYEKLIKLLDEIADTPMDETPLEIGKKVVNTISNQDVMTDDNGSHDTMSAEVLYGYNRRLNMAQVGKVMHTPLQPSVQWAKEYYEDHGAEEQHMWQINIYSKNGGRMALMKTTETGVNVRWPLFVFYPNTNATEAVLIHGDTRYKVRLREHKALNGMFWLGDIYNKFDDLKDYRLNPMQGGSPGDCLSLKNVNRTVDESNKIYTSETDNPFYVPFGNINIAGGGEVRALCANAQALSQGQFGQFPLYCFTTEGVWAMTVNDTGGWATIQPMTRDVIADGTMPLSLDSTVVFMSDRGLLQLAGAEVKILSEPLMNTDLTLEGALSRRTAIMTALGEDFATMDTVISSLNVFPRKNVNLAYDAKNARIYVTERNSPSWVYNLKSGLWTQATTHIDRQVVSYPECLTQQGQDIVTIGDLGDLPTRRYTSGLILTRPIKLGDMGVLKKWHEMMVRGHESPYNYGWGKGDVQTALWGSRDFLTYALVGTSTLPRLTRRGGSPYFAHCVMVAVRAENETASSPLFNVWINGMDIEMTTEQTNKLR